MKRLEFKRIGLLIGITLLITLSIQVWRMASQWDLLQAELKQDIQENLDHAVENYFADLAKSDVFALTDAKSTFSAKSSNQPII
jgi:two-component system phosphate regulon sensor histidine kinase PhoR